MWEFTGLQPGTYRVSTTWVEAPGTPNPLTYYLGSTQSTVDQKDAPDAGLARFDDPNGVWFDEYQTFFDYDAAGNVIRAWTSDGKDVQTSDYDSLGNVRRGVDPSGVVVERVYDALGRLRESGFGDANTDINPLDQFTTRFKYDAMGRVREAVDSLGRVTRFEYDGRGRLVKQINPDGSEATKEYDAFGNCIAKTDELGRTTRFVYDSRNRLIQTIHPDGAVERMRYDGAGHVIASTDALGAVTTFKYDAAGRLTETKLPDPDGSSGPLTSPTTTNKYDLLGRLRETIDPELNVTQFKYDKFGRVVQSQTLEDTSGNRTAIAYSQVGTLVALSTTDYDALGNVRRAVTYDVSAYNSAQTDALEADPRSFVNAANIAANLVQVVTTTYDAFSRPVEVVNADSSSTRTVYDPAGRVRRQIDERGNITTLSYDQFGRLVQTTLPDPNISDSLPGPTTKYFYDAAGNQFAIIDARGFTTGVEYDVFNRPSATTDPLGNRSRTVYDAAGQLIATVDALGRVVYSRRDKRGRVELERLADPDGIGKATAPTSRFKYDLAGRLQKETDPSGYETNYRYDALGRLTGEDSAWSQVVDNSDVEFSIESGTGTASDDPMDFGGDSKLVANNTVGWFRFENLQPGTYRIAATWRGAAAATSNLVYYIFNNAGTWPETVSGSGISQQTAPTDFYRDDDGQWRGYKTLAESFTLGTGQDKISVRLWGYLGNVHADAVRLERIATRSFEYDANGNVVAETDALGRKTTSTYDELDRVVEVRLPDPDTGGSYQPAGGSGPNTSSNDLSVLKTTTSYDGYGNAATVLEHRSSPATQRTTKYVYDSRNRRVEEILDFGSDGSGGVSDYVNQKTTFAYDAAGNLTEQKEWSEIAAGQFELQRRNFYAYDALDRQVVAIENVDAPTTAGLRLTYNYYDDAGNLKKVEHNPGIDPRQVKTEYAYDALGRRTRTTESGLVNGATESRATHFQYDAVGNLVAEFDPLFRVWRNEYDRLDRLAKSLDPDPDGPQSPAPSPQTLFAYDAAGRRVSHTNAANETERSIYDAAGNLARTIDGRGDETVRRYDLVGNQVKLTDPAGNVTVYQFDNLDRLMTETTLSGARKYAYAATGNLTLLVDRNGRAIRRQYDRLDRPTFEWWYASESDARANNSSYSDLTSYFYDKLGRPDEEQFTHRTYNGSAWSVDYRLTESRLYDGLDRIVEQSNQSVHNAGHTLNAPATSQIYAYAYDSWGLSVQRRQLVGGLEAAVTVSSYNPFGELVRVLETDPPGGPLAFNPHVATFTYDRSGRLTVGERRSDWDVALGGGDYHNQAQTNYFYDGAGRLAYLNQAKRRRTTTTWPSFEQLVFFTYGYDAASRISSIATDWNTSALGLTTRSDLTETFTYDLAGQLTAVDSSLAGQDAGYGYQPNGNRTAAIEPGGGTDNYTTGAANRVERTNDTGSGKDYRYEYDNEGNVTARIEQISDGAGGVMDGGSLTTYAWDHRNRLTKVVQVNQFGGGHVETVNYRYDASGQLVHRGFQTTFGNPPPAPTAERYVVEDGRRMMTLDGDTDKVLRRYAYGPADEVLFDQAFNALGQETALKLPLGDHQNSTRVVLDGLAGTVKQSVDYAPFGRVTAVRDANGAPTTAAVDTVFTHHGSLTDAATGLQLKGARWYSPDLGRFISEDPIEDGSNWYLAFGNDPFNYADPTGLFQQGHPLANLAGGYSGNRTTASKLPLGNTTLGFNSNIYQTQPVNFAGATRFVATPNFTESTTTRPYLTDQSGSLGLRPIFTSTTPRLAPRPASTVAAPNLFGNLGGFDPAPRPTPSLGSLSFASTPTPRIGAVAPYRFERDSSPSAVNAAYFNRLANDSAFRNSVDERYALSNAQYYIDRGTPGQAFSAQLITSINAISGDVQPGVGEYQDVQTLLGRGSTGRERLFAAGSLALNILTAGEAPNYSTARRSFSYNTHTLDDILTAQRYTQQFDVLPNGHFLSQIDTAGHASAQLGQQGQRIASEITGAAQNTQKFLVNGRQLIPDQVLAQNVFTRAVTYAAEVKNKLYQAYTRQLRDLAKLVGPTGRAEVFLPPNARVSGPLQEAFNNPRNPLTRQDLIVPNGR